MIFAAEILAAFCTVQLLDLRSAKDAIVAYLHSLRLKTCYCHLLIKRNVSEPIIDK